MKRTNALEPARAPDPARCTRRAAAAAVALSLWPTPQCTAAAFPSRPVRIVVPYSVGLGPDVIARSVAEQLSQRWGLPVQVDNKPGASGIVAFADIRRTRADGHTVYLADTATLCVNPLVHTTLPYDPQQDLVPLGLLFRGTFVLWTGATSPVRDLSDLMQMARRGPEVVRYASLGHAHASQLAVETFARAAGLQLLHVPYSGAGPLLSGLVAGEVDFTAISLNSVADLYRQGRLRPLAVAARQRLAELPDVPTLLEAGGPAVEMHPWAGLVALRGTPASVLRQWQHDLMAVLQSARLRQQAEGMGYEITPAGPQALLERMKADIALYAPLVAEGRIQRP